MAHESLCIEILIDSLIKSNYDYIRIIQAKGQHIHLYGHIDHKTGRQIVIVNMLTLKTKK